MSRENTLTIEQLLDRCDNNEKILLQMYLSSIIWLNRNPGQCPEAEQIRGRIQEIVTYKRPGTLQEVNGLTIKLFETTAAALLQQGTPH